MPAYTLEKKEGIDKILSKLMKRNPKQLEIIYKKLEQILEDPYRFKPLRNDMKDYREVHIDKHFVLVYSIDESRKIVILQDYDHHNNIFG
jgi:YafQ family addiction module toxin component